MFFPNPAAAAAGLPDQLAGTLPFGVLSFAKAGSILIFDANNWRRVDQKDRGFTFPMVTHSVDPDVRDARRQDVEGIVTTTVYVSDKGKVEDIWVANSLGSGTDEKAIEAVAKYRFKAAQYDGHAVGTEIDINVNFAIN